GACRFDAHAHRFLRTLQTPVERVSFAAFVVQSALNKHLRGFFSGHGNLLIACMKITSYNQHCSAPFSEPWSLNSYQAYSVEGADNVIQSAVPTVGGALVTGIFSPMIAGGLAVAGLGEIIQAEMKRREFRKKVSMS